METKIWILNLVVSALSTLMMTIFTIFLRTLISNLKELVREMRELKISDAQRVEQIKHLQESHLQNAARMNIQDDRIRDIELTLKSMQHEH